jgi:hypothetical protein
MRSGPTLILSISFMVLSSCAKYYGCDQDMDCLQERPEKGWVEISLSPSDEGDSLGLKVREGGWKSGRTVHSGEVDGNTPILELPVQKRYTAELIYASEGDTLLAYDSGRLDLQEKKNCDEVCYRIDTLQLELRRADR